MESLPPKAIPAADLQQARQGLFQLLGALPLLNSRLSRAERYRLGPKATEDARWLAEQVATAMNAAPDAYPDIPFTAAEMNEAFQQTKAAFYLWQALAMYAELAHDHYLMVLAETGEAARQAVRIVADAPGATDEMAVQRGDGMALALMRHKDRSARAWKTRRELRGQTPTGRPRKQKTEAPSSPLTLKKG